MYPTTVLCRDTPGILAWYTHKQAPVTHIPLAVCSTRFIHRPGTHSTMLTQQARMPQLGRHIHTSPGAKTSAHPATPQTLHGSQRLYSLKPASHHRSPRNQDLTSPLSLSVLVPAPRCNARLVPHAVLDKIHGDASSNPSTTRSESSVPCAGATATPRPPQDRPTKLRALVFGSGLAGLATARVLSDHFDEVCSKRTVDRLVVQQQQQQQLPVFCICDTLWRRFAVQLLLSASCLACFLVLVGR